jgi:hypothetical protein
MSFTGWPEGLSAEEPKKGALEAASSGRSWAVRKELSSQQRTDQARNFSMFERKKTNVAIGDQVRFTKNVKHWGRSS